MGSGGSKSHQAFTITPASPAIADPPPASELDDGTEPAQLEAQAVGEVSELDEELNESAAAGDETIAAVAIDPVEPADWTDTDLLTRLPDQLDIGDGAGLAIAVGGADLVDGAATLISYRDTAPGGPAHEVLCCRLTTDAEDKLLDALIPANTPKIAALVETDVDGRLALDTDNNLHEQLATIARSINSHLKAGTPIPAHTHTNLANVTNQLTELDAATPHPSTDADMIAAYQHAAQLCAERCAPGFDTAYHDGGRVPQIDPYEHHGTATITQLVPDPNFVGDGLTTKTRKLTRIGSELHTDGTHWDGKSRHPKGVGTELVVDLGDGYQAIFRPSTMNPAGASDASLHNTLEIVAPPGSGHHHQLVDRLSQLNIVNRPMNRTEAEWAYLSRNIYAHQLDHHPAVTAALTNAAGIEDAHEQALLVSRGHQAAGLDDAALATFARQLRLDAEADALADKVRLVRNGVATALGHPTGTAMADSAGYNPTPKRRRGWLAWDRIGQDPTTLASTFAGRSLIHHVTGHNLVEVMSSGVLASNERRRLMGIHPGKGMSEGADQKTGGASSVFLRIRNTDHVPKAGPQLVWDDPGRLLSRTDWYAYNGDHFGAAVSGTGHSTSGQTRDPAKFASFNASNNEVMIAHGLDLLGADAPSRIMCANTKERDTIINQLTSAGINTLGSKPLHKVIT